MIIVKSVICCIATINDLTKGTTINRRAEITRKATEKKSLAVMANGFQLATIWALLLEWSVLLMVNWVESINNDKGNNFIRSVFDRLSLLQHRSAEEKALNGPSIITVAM